MAEIVKLEHPANVTLIAGATQFWSDRTSQDDHVDWSALLVPQTSGRTLVVGCLPSRTLSALEEASGELHVLVRGIVDAAQIANEFPDATVWCGDPRDLPAHTGPFDTVMCLVDAATVLPLESPSRTWEQVTDDLLALAAPGATTLLWVENDLGIHRLTAPRNPRASHGDRDWDVMATWDATRPRTLETVRAHFPDADVRMTWPTARFGVLVDPAANPVAHAVFAVRACATPVQGADPLHVLAAATHAGRLAEFASGWFVTLSPRTIVEAPAHLAEPDGVVAIERTLPVTARPALLVFGELAAAHDWGGIRSLMAAWGATYADGSAGDASFGLNVVERDDSGWRFTALGTGDVGDQRHAALGELVGVMRARGWRHPWPANHSDARILNHLAIMAGLRPVGASKAVHLVPPTEPPAAADAQTLAARVDRNEEMIAALRSELEISRAQMQRLRNTTGPLRLPRRVLGVGKRAVRRLLGRAGRRS